MPSDIIPGVPPIDRSQYEMKIKQEEKEFYKQITGINDDEELKQHIFKIQDKAYTIFPYPCIRGFVFASFQLCQNPRYKEIVKLGKERPNAIYLEIGCAFGTDLRKLVADGFPFENVIASDIRSEYIDLGHQLFRTTPETYPLAFIQGDIFELASEFNSKGTSNSNNNGVEALPPLRTLTSLATLQSRVSIICASSFFHLFSPEKQRQLAHILARLLSPSSGSMIVGKQAGVDDKTGIYKWDFGHPVGEVWNYSVSAWKELWMGDEGPFKESEVDAVVEEEELLDGSGKMVSGGNQINVTLVLHWCITRR